VSTPMERNYSVEANLLQLQAMTDEPSTIRYITRFQITDKHQQEISYHMVMEQGSMTLEELFSHQGMRSPESFKEIQGYWREFENILQMICTLHRLKG
jgi:hypothetical protein